MMTSNLFTLRWGILATGGIANTFTKDLLIDPTTRDAGDIRHEVAAAASSTSAARAQDFLNEVGAPGSAKAYGSYRELVEAKGVDIIYIATPHSHHYQHARLALEAGKHVLLEKPIAVNAQQCRILRDLAKERGRFLMEAVWTRFFPLSREVVEFVRSGQLGHVKRVFADFSFWNDVEKEFGNQHRMVNLDLAGGALLDLGIYSLTWLFMALYHVQPKETQVAPHVSSAVTKYKPTGADETTTVLLLFPGTGAQGIATTSIQVATTPNPDLPAPDAIRIQGTFGDLTVNYAPRPRSYTLTPAASQARGTLASFKHETKSFEIPGGGHGMFWEADECARCVRDGRLESDVIPLEETEALMKVMDEVRRQADLAYPESIENLEYPLEGFGL
ncbi:NAD(P)-binding protein [Cucurbitaria berberidis CBS 394.84]|uniref:D-xylose 1-dehydrogenase (NADP(+), D-xylono-1,5-lactone-forming) n=1 Tax=Cucurbitaria berberidis CBS 394.84 TaxID=1168544 RepID=A0A9P4GFI5_9PLEO|nr:NAD(P)-binding protein [Cucurbitaria berberidis CBS 394.84]KAF1844620.1 NAD(P)-binding protein [Cucurbitaria berberidis CBS 394.84]